MPQPLLVLVLDRFERARRSSWTGHVHEHEHGGSSAVLAALLCAALAACGGPVAAGAPPSDGGAAISPSDGGDGGPSMSLTDGGDAGPSDAGAAGDADGGLADAGNAGPADGGPSDAGDGGPSDAADAGPPLLGRLVGGPGPAPGPIEGIRYRSGPFSGYTDAQGGFAWQAGEPVVFSVADLDLRAAPGRALLSPYDLVTGGACAPSDELARLLVLLAGLDDDANPATGIRLAHYPPGAAQRQFAALSASGVETKIGALMPGRGAPPAQPLLEAFALQLAAEQWAQLSVDTFTGADAARRSQGIATDGSRWFFSWKLGLDRTALGYSAESHDDLAIPPQLALAGSDHIGDLDWWAGRLYCAIEDGRTGYKAPYLVTFDPESLQAKDTHPLDPSLLTLGVPWVAADGPRGHLIVAEWNPTLRLELYAIDGFSHAGSLPLSRTLGRIQGAKVFEGSLYAAADDADKTVYKIDLETGAVLPLFAMKHGQEQEGLALLAHGGALMHTLNVAGSTSMELRHHARTRDPLRRSVCP